MVALPRLLPQRLLLGSRLPLLPLLLLLLRHQQLPAAIAPGDNVDADNALDVGVLENLALDERLGVDDSLADAATGFREPKDLVYPLYTLAEEVQHMTRPDYQLAEKLYRTAIALDPANAALRYNFGIVRKNLKDHRGAIEEYEAALARA